MSISYPFVQHHGAISGVTGSCHQLWLTSHDSILIDCGLFQGAEISGQGAGGASQTVEFPLDSIHALIATHVHIDHIGRLPWLIAAGFSKHVVCTQPSALLMPTVLEDAFMVAVKRDSSLAQRFVGRVSELIQGHPYNQWTTVVENARVSCRVRFQPAGHIIGSAWVECDVRYPEQKGSRRIIFSGDLGAPHAPLLPAPKSPYRADVVILESTYGDRRHENRRSRKTRLKALLEQALADGGTVLVPAFSIGRTQDLLYELEDIIATAKPDSGQHFSAGTDWNTLPVILDSPLATRFTSLYRQLKPYWDVEALKRVSQGRKPLGFKQLLTVESHAQHQAMVNRLAHTRQPAVVIAGSGMCNAGRIVNYLKAMLGDPRNNVVFVGYQAKGTPGSVIQRFGPDGGYVDLDDERFHIAAGIHSLGGYSAHADQAGLVRFITGMRHWPEEIRLVHGSPEAKATLASVLQEKANAKDYKVRIVIPALD